MVQGNFQGLKFYTHAMGTFTLTKFKNTNKNYGENKKSIIIKGSGFPVVKKLLESADLYCSLSLSF